MPTRSVDSLLIDDVQTMPPIVPSTVFEFHQDFTSSFERKRLKVQPLSFLREDEDSSVLQDSSTEETQTVAAAALFVLIGAKPNTEWLPASILRDERGFILTGSDLNTAGDMSSNGMSQRQPLLLETSVSGVFAVGDVRHGSVKRVAAAVGEGGIAIQSVHQYLAQNRRASV